MFTSYMHMTQQIVIYKARLMTEFKHGATRLNFKAHA